LPDEEKKKVIQIALLFRPQLNYFQELIELTDLFFRRPDPKIIVNQKDKILLFDNLRKELSQLEK